jgi:hypothetical protein
MYAFQALCYACPQITNYLRSDIVEKELCVKRRASCEFVRRLKKYYHALIDGKELDMDDLNALVSKTPKKLQNCLQHTLKTMHAALEVSHNCSFITDVLSINEQNTVFFLYHEGESVPASMAVGTPPHCLLIFGDTITYHPFTMTINQTHEYRLLATFDSARCLYVDEGGWKEWDGNTTTACQYESVVCKSKSGAKCLSYVRVTDEK